MFRSAWVQFTLKQHHLVGSMDTVPASVSWGLRRRLRRRLERRLRRAVQCLRAGGCDSGTDESEMIYALKIAQGEVRPERFKSASERMGNCLGCSAQAAVNIFHTAPGNARRTTGREHPSSACTEPWWWQLPGYLRKLLFHKRYLGLGRVPQKEQRQMKVLWRDQPDSQPTFCAR